MYKDFYPTPRWLIEKMLHGLHLRDSYILEPSAGKGDILDVLAERVRKEHLYAIEIEPELRSILRDKGYSVIHDDFLTYDPHVHFDFIIMNPPFSQAERHLQHAWKILYEGEIVCLLPAHVLEPKNSLELTISQIVKDHGSVENVGKAFARGAERAQDEEIVIVRLIKEPHGEKIEFDVHNDRSAPQFSDGIGKEVAIQGFVADLLAHHDAALANYEKYREARQRLLRYVQPFDHQYDNGSTQDILREADAVDGPQGQYNRFVELVTAGAWNRILNHPDFQSFLTERARKMLAEFRARQRRVDFNTQNIKAMFTELIARQDEFLMSAILDAFDTMTEHHKENRIYFEGWKSDKCWKVNHRVVLPYCVDPGYGHFSLNYRERDALTDIDRALCVVAKIPFESITTIEAALVAAFQNQRGPGQTESTFFKTIRWYYKGTLHLTFRDRELLAKFNLLAAKGRNWLPPGEGTWAPAETKSPEPSGVVYEPDPEDAALAVFEEVTL